MTTLAEVEAREDQGVVVVRIEGEMDISNTPYVEERLTRALSNSALGMVLDLSGLNFLDSSGVELFFRLRERLEERRQQLVVALPADAVIRRVFEIVRLGEKLAVTPSVEEAKKVFRPAEE